MSRLAAGQQLSHYRILAPLGEGGMGEVYRAHDPRLGRDVALKVLNVHLASAPDLRARFEREARTLSQLQHPFICTLFDVGHASGPDGDLDFLVMELIDGEALSARLARGPLPLPELLRCAEQVTSALVVAHREGLVHRDLKPANLMLTESGVKLLDFGLARATAAPAAEGSASTAPTVNQPLTGQGAIVGTFQYMAPEQLEGREPDARTDVFALGCVLHEMATGARPFQGHDGLSILGSMHRDKPAAVARLAHTLPAGLAAIIGRCLENDPAQRYASAEELLEALRELRRWPREKALPELTRLCERILLMEEGDDSWNAFLLARQIDALEPGEAIVERLRAQFSAPVTILSDPPGARVTAWQYSHPDDAPLEMGVTPIMQTLQPRGLVRIQLELAGHRTVRDVIINVARGLSNGEGDDNATWRYTLHAPDALPAGMEEVPAGGAPVFLPGLDHLDVEPTARFLVDRTAVTNAQYKRFVDAGGYADATLWREAFVDGDEELTHAQAMTRFVDSVGQPGPAHWEMGDFPAGEADHPVCGVSWYEAAAYAAWANKTLPTLFHWSRVACTFANSQIVPFANLGGRGTVSVNTTRSENRFGVHDLAGNVREWIRNPVNRPGNRFILGGGWSDAGYAFVDAYAQPSFDRSNVNGFRCIREVEHEPNAAIARTIEMAFRDFRAEQPVPDAVFDFFVRQFAYDKTPLDAVLRQDVEVPTGRWQTVSINAAYGSERLDLHVFLPARGKPPYQTVVLFPGSLALHTRAFNLNEIARTDFIVKSGRALVLPVYKSTYERGDDYLSDYPAATVAYKDHVIMYAKDLSRAIDWIETAPELDALRVGYFGTSWGGAMGAIMPAVEARLRANVLYVAGLCFQRSLPEIEQLNYLPRVKQPTLMLNGELDFFFPADTSQIPFFEHLGTPPEHKRRLTYPRGHTVPKADLIRETLAWFDRYLGPVG